jgi:histone deacetylase 1/2
MAAFLHQLGFGSTRSDASLFVFQQGSDAAYLLLYVNDIILTACNDALLRQLTDRPRAEFAIKDLGPLHYFLGLEVVRRVDGFFLHQRKYAQDILEHAGMLNCSPAATPVDTNAKLSATAGSPAIDASHYRSIVGGLHYLTLTRPELQHAVQQVCLYMHAPRDAHWTAVRWILWYIRGSMDLGLTISASPSMDIVAYSDADWAGCPDTRRSTSGYCVYLGSSLISWSSKRQPIVSRSSVEAEYRAVANAVAECTWLHQLLSKLACPVDKATVVFCDNVSAVYLSANPVHHRRTKHIELDIHFVREKVALSHVRVLYVPISQQFADIMTKGLLTLTFSEFWSSLCVAADPSTAGGC